jgi:hypothetical protein
VRSRIIILSFLLAVCGGENCPAWCGDISPILKVGSAYRNVGDGAKVITETGTGILVDIPSLATRKNSTARYQFILTDAHLVQGADPWVEIDGKPVRAHASLSDAENDVAILEIPATGKSGAYVYRPEAVEDAPGDRFLPTEALSSLFKCEKGKIDCSSAKPDEFDIIRAGPYSGAGSIVSPGWSSPGSKENPLGNFRTLGGISGLPSGATFFGNAVNTAVTASPGNSGALFVDSSGNHFGGLPVESDFFFRRTRIADPSSFENLISDFSSGRRGALGGTRWKMRNELSYLDFGDGMIDADFVRIRTGNGTSSPPGNGTSSPPGENGQCPSPVDPLPLGAHVADIASRLMLARDEGPGIDPDLVFHSFGLHSSAMSLAGMPVYGFKVVENSTGISLMLYPNVEARQWQRNKTNQDAYMITPVTEQPDFVDLLQQKVRAKQSIDGSRVEGFGRVLKSQYKDADRLVGDLFGPEANGAGQILIDHGQIHVSWEIRDTLLGAKTGSHAVDQLDFTLDRFGRLAGRKVFEPIIRVKGKNGSEYYVDLRPLFFTDLSINFPTPTNSLTVTHSVSGAARMSLSDLSLTRWGSQMGIFIHTIKSPSPGETGVEHALLF